MIYKNLKSISLRNLNCELSSIAVSDDGTKLLIGSNENMGCAYDIVL